jgi:predicted ATPase
MLIGFIGCPCSGKTTTAAMTFADLKTMGIATELIPEQARLVIAEKRVLKGLKPEDTVELTESDQYKIIQRQEQYEGLLIKACGPEVTLIADSSVVNTLLYMPSDLRADLHDEVVEFLLRYDLLFYCAPVKPPSSQDPNRVHTYEQSLKIDREIPKLLSEFNLKPVGLFGEPKDRHHVVLRHILEYRMSRHRS